MPDLIGTVRERFDTASRFVRHAIERRRHPERFIENDHTPFQEIYRDGLLAVRYYPPLLGDSLTVAGLGPIPVKREPHKLPVVLVPPLGVFPWVFDLLRDRSLVAFLRAQGFEVYLIDWGAPGEHDYELSLDTYVNQWFPRALSSIRHHAGEQQLSLFGYCMGGLLCLMYQGVTEDPAVRNIVTVASPIDFHQSGVYGELLTAVQRPLLKISDWTGFRIKQLDAKGFHVPGEVLSLMFKATNIPGTINSYLTLVRNLADREFVTDYMSMANWFNRMPDYPGAVIQEIAVQFALRNQMAEGRMRIGDKIADFGRITSNLLAFGGRSDKIVAVNAASHLVEVVASEDLTFEVVAGGHAGVIAGGKAPREVWGRTAEWLAARSD